MSADGQRRGLQSRWLDFVLAHHKQVFLLGTLLTVLCGWLSSRLEIEPDLRALLPDKGPVIRSFDEVEEKFGVIESVHVVVKGGTREARHAIADEIAVRFADHPMLDSVSTELDDRFFVDHALYYLSDAEMEELSELVLGWQHYGLCSRAPDVCTTRPDPRAPDRLEAFIETKRSEARERVGFERYYEREGVEALLAFLHPNQGTGDLEFADELTSAVRKEIDDLLASEGPWAGQGIEIGLVGPYAARAGEREVLRRDMRRSLAAGLGGVLLILYLLFRSFRALLTLTVPLMFGLTWSMGATELVLGHLNTMTSLISSVLLGLGIDAGIHLLSRARKERREHDDETSIRRAFESLLSPLLVASSTTIGAFVVMATSGYPAFREFGIVSGMGVALCLLAMVTVYPAALMWVGVKAPPERATVTHRIGSALLARPALVFFALLALTVAAVPGVQKTRKHGFERSARTLQSDEIRERVVPDAELISKVFDKNVHVGLMVVEGFDEMSRIYAQARAKHADRLRTGDTVVAELVALPRFMPPPEVDLEKRRAAIEALTEDFDDSTWAKLEGQAGEPDEFGETPPDDGTSLSKEDAKALRRMIDAKPFGVDDLPKEVLDRFRGADDTWAILAYPTFSPTEILLDLKYVEETADYGANEERVYVGEPAVPAAMYALMTDEWPVIVGMASILVFGIVLWQLRSVSQTTLTLLPLVVGFWWLLGLMGTTGIRFTLVNVPILPAVLGIGVDNGVYLAVAISRREKSPDGLRAAVDGTARAILAATATTACGFASFLVADNGGLRSIGLLAVVGITMAAFAALTVMPTLAALGERRRSDAGETMTGGLRPRRVRLPTGAPKAGARKADAAPASETPASETAADASQANEE